MSKQRKFVHLLASIGVIAVGLYMFFSYAWPTPPAVSGLGFFLTGLALWMNHCPIMKYLFERN
jgi:uncharacterized membrane protein